MRDHVSPRAVLGLHPVGFAVETTEGRRTRFCRRAGSRAAEPPHSNRMWRDALRYLATAFGKGTRCNRTVTVQPPWSKNNNDNPSHLRSAGAFSEVVFGHKPILRRPCNPPLRPFLRQPQQHTSWSRTQPTPSGRRRLGLGSSARCAVEGNATTKRLATTCRAHRLGPSGHSSKGVRASLARRSRSRPGWRGCAA